MPFTPTGPNLDLDLTDVALVKSYAGVTDSSRDGVIQLMITGASAHFLRMTGHVASGEEPSSSPFITPQAYSEVYDGSGTDTQFLRSWPIQSASVLAIDGQHIPSSTGWNIPGYFIADDKKSLQIRSCGGANSSSLYFGAYSRYAIGRTSGYLFTRGTGNVEIQSVRGFNSVPVDVIEAVTQIVSVNLLRSTTEGITSMSASVAGRSGSVSFSPTVIPPKAWSVALYYKATSWT